ncbi:MAG: PadR family transcriptional regulator [Candidatus Bathyarchaeia archaeon]
MVKVDQAFLQGLEKPIILCLLSRGPRHGYGLIKELMSLTGRRLKPSIVYPFLHWLEKEGFAVGKWAQINERKVKYYSLTEKGEKLLNRVREFFKRPIKEIMMDLLIGERK